MKWSELVNKKVIIGIVIAVLLVGGIATFVLLKGKDNTSSSENETF